MRLTELPAGWDDSKLRWLFRVDSGDQISSERTVDVGYPLVGGNGTRGFVREWNTRGPLIVVGRVGALCGNVHEYGGRIWASEHALRLFPRSNFCLRYFTYALESAALNQLALGTAQPVIAASRLGEERLPVPPLPTQRAIASFLDRETEKIDTLIEKKRRLLDLLEEKRTALITRAVTRGLNSDAPMKDSGVEWLREIPEHWGVGRAKALFELHRGFDLPATDREEGVYPVVSSGGVIGSHFVAKVEGPGVVTGRTGTLGEVYFVEDDFWPLNTALYVRRFRGNEPRFIRWLLGLIPVLDYAAKSAVPGVDRKDLHDAFVPYPPLEEQRAIGGYLDDLEGDFLDVRSAVTHAISLLQEYRTSVISHAVTGKIDIRDKVPA